MTVTRADLEGGLRFCHALLDEGQALADTLDGRLDALVAALSARGAITADALEARTDEQPWPDRPDDVAVVAMPEFDVDELPDIDCHALMPLCGVRCCSFSFPLSEGDLDAGVVRWDPRAPYLVKQDERGRCVHLGPGGACQVYEHRPATCRRYSCRNDFRVWLDFESRFATPTDPDAPSRARVPLRWRVRYPELLAAATEGDGRQQQRQDR